MSSLLIRQDLVPIVAGYVLVMGALAVGLLILRRPASGSGAAGTRRPAAAPGPAHASALQPHRSAAAASRARQNLRARTRPGPGWPRLIIHLAATVAGGYLMLMAVVILYYYGVARAGSRFLDSAFSGCALLLGLSMPAFLAASWLSERRARRPGAGAREPPAGSAGSQ
jgi:Family of unknown function (DUF6256)